MAKYTSLFTLRGKVGDLVFYKLKGEKLVRSVPKIEKHVFKNSPNYERTRKLNAEFSYAAKDSKLFRKAFEDILMVIDDRSLHSKLNGTFMKLSKFDLKNELGERRAYNSNFECLNKQEIHARYKFSRVYTGKYSTEFNRETGICKIQFQGLNFNQTMDTSKVTNSCRLLASIAKIDFANGSYVNDFTLSEFIPLKKNHHTIEANRQVSNIELTLNLDPQHQGTLFVIIGVEFSVLENGYRSKTYGHCAVLLVPVD